MKRIVLFIFSAAALVMLGSCNRSATSYANQLKAEKKLIEQYIKHNNIVIIHEEPAYDEWKENEYLELADYCYFHLTQQGDTTTDAITANDNLNVRYRQYTLVENADTLSYWNTNEAPYPMEYTLATVYSACEGWYYALLRMKYTGAEGKLICPSKLGPSSKDVIPYGYDLKLQVRRF